MAQAEAVKANQSLPWRVAADAALGQSSGASSADLVAWYLANKADIDQKILTHGAVLFRGFGVDTPAAFAEVTKALCPEPMEGLEENVPRTKVSAGVYTSTEFPAGYTLSMHSEYSYSHLYPARLTFCCIVPPASSTWANKVLNPFTTSTPGTALAISSAADVTWPRVRPM